MAIYRLQFRGGMQLPLGSFSGSIPELVARIAEAREEEIEQLDGPDEIRQYYLTPQTWTKHTHEHHLIVFPDGTGLYLMIPRDKYSGWRFVEGDTRSEIVMGESSFAIPSEKAAFILSEPTSDGEGILVHEVIFHG